MSREAKKREAKKTQRTDAKVDALMMAAVHQFDALHGQLEALQNRVDYYRNIFVGSAFAAGLGNERPITELVKEAHPALLGIERAS